ncbi:DUF4442 domain-containing protein [Streptomonospora wellingtoniae]|uniref:DUF4442 domain-containing protein n=1 Tax=Streptomonospora wellingtoniae TaxID=3075544 RepID=A0ABU2KY50_9ACTN|nr:DUF4442 domain-containing protein [Streptomonospora sp. DSM 45055]MDT0303968.1 DUF4442 domain-containing protein [Streptomonospora sp. DSM 45055]
MATMNEEAAEVVKSGFLAAVPFARTLGVEFLEVDYDRIAMRLPDTEIHHNHVGGPHAGAMFTLGESASGAIITGAFGHLLDRAVPLAVKAEIHYRKLAMGDVIAEARLNRPREEIEAELESGGRPEFAVEVGLGTADGTATGAMTVTWTLKPIRR